MDPRTFAVELLGVGDWPPTDGTAERVIDPAAWKTLTDPASKPEGPVAFAFDVRPDRSYSTIGVAGIREDGQTHLEIVDRKRGTGWVTARLGELLCKARRDRGRLRRRRPRRLPARLVGARPRSR